MKKEDWKRNYDRQQLRQGRALRIGSTVYHASDTIDIEQWLDLPSDATIKHRCTRAWFLRNYHNYGHEEGRSFNYWASFVAPYGYKQDDWTDYDREHYDNALVELKKIEEEERRNKGRRRWRDRSARKPQRNARRHWRKVRNYLLSTYPGFAAGLRELV